MTSFGDLLRSNGKLASLPWVLLFSSTIFLGAYFHIEFFAVALSILISFVFVACSNSTKRVWVSTCLWLLLFQNTMIGLGSHWGGNLSSDLSYLTQIPTLLIAVVFLASLIASVRNNKENGGRFFSKWVLLLVATIAVLFFIGNAPITSKLISVRNLLMFYMAYEVAFTQCQKDGGYLSVLKQLSVVAVVATVFGVIMMLQDVSFWESIGIYEVYLAKQSPIEAGTLGGRFYTSLNGVTDVLRMGSFYYEPVNLAYLLLAGLLASCFLWKSKRISIFFPMLIAVGFVLTFGKGGYMLLAFLILVFFCNKALSSLARTAGRDMRFPSYLICLIVIGTAAYLYYILIGGPVRPHFWALEQTLSSIFANPVGYGLGMGGNMSIAGSDYSKGAESAIMTFAYQIGIFGVICVFMSLRDIAKQAPSGQSFSASIAYYIPLALFAVSILQENTFSPQCVFPMMVLTASLQGFARFGDAPIAQTRSSYSELNAAASHKDIK